MTAHDREQGPALVCRACGHEPALKAKFCDRCGAATSTVLSDWETLQHYCGRCSGMLRGAKSFCSYCGEASPHSGKKVPPQRSPIVEFIRQPSVQITAVVGVIGLALLPWITPLRLSFVPTAPFVRVYAKTAPAAARPAQRVEVVTSRERWSARPLLEPEDFGGETGLLEPSGLARDAAGFYYVADAASHRIYRISPQGEREVFAGAGEPGFDGDGGNALAATLDAPRGLAFDDQQNLYVADSGNHRVRMIDRDGVIRTIAGCGACTGAAAQKASALDAGLRSPVSVEFRGGYLLVAEAPHAEGRPAAVWALRPTL